MFERCSVISSGYGKSVFPLGIVDSGQSLQCEPCWIGSVLYGKFAVGCAGFVACKSVGNVHSVFAAALNGKRQRGNDFNLVGEQRQIVLFAVGECAAVGSYFAYKQWRCQAFFGFEGECNHCFAFCVNAEPNSLTFNYGKIFCILHCHDRFSAQRFFGKVLDCCGNCCIVAKTQETRHVGLYHKFFDNCGGCVSLYDIHCLCMCENFNVPAGKAFGSGERNGQIPVFVRAERGSEEGCLGKVFANGNFFCVFGGFG